MALDSSLDSDDELEAVNDIIGCIGEAPVNTLEGEGNVDVANVRRILARVNREVQAKGWTFNIDESAILVPDVFSKFIPWLPTYLSIMTTGGSLYVNRGGYVYDRTSKTDQFEASITVSLIELKAFSEMPEAYRSYIIAKAARRFNIQFFGAAEIEGSLQERESEAWAAVQEFELDFGNYNMLDGDAFTGGAIGR